MDQSDMFTQWCFHFELFDLFFYYYESVFLSNLNKLSALKKCFEFSLIIYWFIYYLFSIFYFCYIGVHVYHCRKLHWIYLTLEYPNPFFEKCIEGETAIMLISIAMSQNLRSYELFEPVYRLISSHYQMVSLNIICPLFYRNFTPNIAHVK